MPAGCRNQVNPPISEDFFIKKGGAGMKPIHINHFLRAASFVFDQFHLPFKIGNPSIKSSPFSGNEVLTVVGITGDHRGHMYIGGSVSNALKVVSVLMGQDRLTLDSVEQSAVAEMANMICGNAVSIFAKENVTLYISPPFLVMGKHIEVPTLKLSLVSVPIILDESTTLNLGIAVEE
jgi:chemotaxis protein CheX